MSLYQLFGGSPFSLRCPKREQAWSFGTRFLFFGWRQGRWLPTTPDVISAMDLSITAVEISLFPGTSRRPETTSWANVTWSQASLWHLCKAVWGICIYVPSFFFFLKHHLSENILFKAFSAKEFLCESTCFSPQGNACLTKTKENNWLCFSANTCF